MWPIVCRPMASRSCWESGSRYSNGSSQSVLSRISRGSAWGGRGEWAISVCNASVRCASRPASGSMPVSTTSREPTSWGFRTRAAVWTPFAARQGREHNRRLLPPHRSLRPIAPRGPRAANRIAVGWLRGRRIPTPRPRSQRARLLRPRCDRVARDVPVGQSVIVAPREPVGCGLRGLLAAKKRRCGMRLPSSHSRSRHQAGCSPATSCLLAWPVGGGRETVVASWWLRSIHRMIHIAGAKPCLAGPARPILRPGCPIRFGPAGGIRPAR